MEFSNPSTEDGIVQEIDRICGSTDVTYSLKAKTARVNQALDQFFSIALQFDKAWHFDDSNQTEFPIGYTDIESGVGFYSFASELLEVREVFVMDSNNVYHKLEEETDPQNTFLLPSGNNGLPTKYRLISGSILLDFIPDYDKVDGLQVIFARGASKFLFTDTTKEPGIPSLFHHYLCWVAALPFLITNRLPQKNDYALLIQQKEDPRIPSSIPSFMSNRNRTRKPRIGILREKD